MTPYDQGRREGRTLARCLVLMHAVLACAAVFLAWRFT